MWLRRNPKQQPLRQRGRAEWEVIIADTSKSLNPGYIKTNIIDAEEQLHLQRIWRRALSTFLILGNLALLTFTAMAIADTVIIGGHPKILYALTAILVAVSPFAAYLQYKRIRSTSIYVKKLNLVKRENLAESEKAARESGLDRPALQSQKRYRDDVPDLISQFREEANRSRRTHNSFQTAVIIGSVITSVVTTASVSFTITRWIAVGVSAVVGLSAGLTGYYKFHERSFNLQQTADAIEREYESVELRVGRYRDLDEDRAYSLFADTVENLRDEQNKRQQQLDQSVDVRRDE